MLNKYNRISPQADLQLQTPFKENYFIVQVLGCSPDGKRQQILFCKVELGQKPDNVESVELRKHILDMETHRNCVMKVGRYSDDDCVRDRKNYLAVIDLDGVERDFRRLVSEYHIR